MIAARCRALYGLLMVFGRQISNSGAHRLAVTTSFLIVSRFKFFVTQRWTDDESTLIREGV